MLKKNDKIVRDQAILRYQEMGARRKIDYKPPQGPGNVVVGSVLDCNRSHFERLLRAYWDRLYVGWNPFKNEGNGCWEVWARPSVKTPTVSYDDGDIAIITTSYKPSDFEHWVDDLPYLNYTFINRLREMDSWQNKQLNQQTDDAVDEYKAKLEKDEDEHLKYVVKHNKSVFRDLLDYTQAGYDPVQFFTKKQ